MVIEWAQVEGRIAFVAAGLLGIGHSYASEALTAELSSASRFRLAKLALDEVRHRLWLDEWESISGEFERLQALRNDVVHGEWSVVGNSHWLRRVRAIKSVRIRSAEFSTRQLEKMVLEIRKLNDALAEFSATVLPLATEAIRTSHEREPLDPSQSRAALAQAQSRSDKQARKAKDRDRATNKAGRGTAR